MSGPLFGKLFGKVNLGDYDRIDTNPENWGGTYYGKDDGEGRTDWYDEDGNLNASSETPGCDDEYQRLLNPWEKENNARDY